MSTPTVAELEAATRTMTIKHPTRGYALVSLPRTGPDSQHRPGGQHR
jgi:hypothetical protein